MYKVRIDKFEGPFDLLIYLLENARMDIYDIKVAEITEQYIGYLKEMEELNVEVDTEFIVLAAVLIRLKSRMLLPRINEAGEIEIVEDPRIELRGRLLDYMRIKKAAEMLMAAEEYNLAVHEKPAEDLDAYMGELEEIIKGSMSEFAQAFMQFILKKQRLEEMHKIYERIERQKMTMENRITQIADILEKKKTAKFSELIENDNTNFNKVITFMSILELLRERSITAEQKKRYGDITIRKAEAAND